MPPVHPDPAPPGRRSPRTVAAALVLAGLLGACGRESGPIQDVRERPTTMPRAPEMSVLERLGGGTDAHGGDPHASMGGGRGASSGASWSFTAPSGWEPLPKAPMRDAGFRVGGSPDAECTLSTAGGSLKENVNRWRRQMGLDPVDDGAIAALPREPFLGRDAVRIELVGTYGGMRGDKRLSDAKMVGLVAELPATSVFVKMVGPASVVDAEMERFRAFARSVKPAGSQAPPEAPGPRPSAGDGPLRWTAPAGWVEGPARSMRVVTLVPSGATRTECYVSLLGGTAGGLAANVNRWRQQMGLEPADPAAIEALPKIPAMGTQGVLVELAGRLEDPMRGVKEDEALLYGFVVEREDGTVFVKMTGPASEMKPQRAAFEAFCRSLEVVR